jgi:cyclase
VRLVAACGWLKILIGASALSCGLLLWSFGLAQMGQAQSNAALDVLRVRKNFYIIAGAGGNIAVQVGTDGVVLVNSGTREASDSVLAAIQKLSDQPIRYIINTSADTDQVGGNAKLSKAGRSIFAPAGAEAPNAFEKLMTNGFAASILAFETVLARMSAPTGKTAPFPSDAWPVETYDQKRKYIYLNGEGLDILHQPAAHSDGDSFVHFRGSDVVVAGDIIDTTRYPLIDIEKGGSIKGEIDALDHLIELAIPSIPFVYQEGGTYIVPGHGRVCDQADIVEYRDMIVIIRDVIQSMMRRGMTLDQIKAASPTKPFESQYGSKSGNWTTNNFVEAVYKSLAK